MRITVITPLFPPDVAQGASYAKELVRRLASTTDYQVTCLHYGLLPEAVTGVEFISVQKNVSRLKRLAGFVRSLYSQRHSDALIILNGPSVELPTLLLSLLLPNRGAYIESDVAAVQASGFFFTFVPYLIKKRFTLLRPAQTVLDRPVIHPLHNYPVAALATYEQAWREHLNTITNLCLPN